MNAIITAVTSEETDRISKMYSKNTKKAKEETVKYLLSNKYTLFGHFGLLIVKIFCAVFFAFALSSETMSVYTQSMSINVTQPGYQLINDSSTFTSPLVVVGSVFAGFFHYFAAKTVSVQSFVSTELFPIISAFIVGGLGFALPTGYTMAMLCYNAIEYAIIMLNLTAFRDRNISFCKATMKKYASAKK